MTIEEEPDNLSMILATHRLLIADLFTLLRDKGIISDAEIAGLIDTYRDHRCLDQVKETLEFVPKA